MANQKKNEKGLTQRQEAILNYLFSEEYFGNPKGAAIAAGYAPGTNVYEVLKPLKKHILDRTEEYLATYAPKAVAGYVKVLDEPTTKGAQNLLSAADKVLDRAGVVKKERMIIEADTPSALLILPTKEKE